jgi:hypothetical protein
MREEITGEALSWDKMKRTCAQRPTYLRSGSVPYFSAVPTNSHSQNEQLDVARMMQQRLQLFE